jgi:ribosomal protein S18 acetylase RimI-like enzyme
VSDFDRAVAFQRAMDARLAERAAPTRNGVVYLSQSLPRVWWRNFLCVNLDSHAAAAELALEAEAVQGAAGFEHRRIAIDDGEHGAAIAPQFRGRGWTVEENVVMTLGELTVIDTPATREVEADDLVAAWQQGIRSTIPDDETVRQLIEAQHSRREAVTVRYFAALVDGRPAAYCELFSTDGVGQVESVMCLEQFRGQGLGKAVTARATAESRAAGHDLTFLVADAADWPQHLYRRLGYRDAGRIWHFLRPPR